MSALSPTADRSSSSSTSDRNDQLTWITQNLERVSTKSDQLRAESFMNAVDWHLPDFIFVQEVDKSFKIDRLNYKEVGSAINENWDKKTGTFSKGGQLNLKVFQRTSSSAQVVKFEAVWIPLAGSNGYQARKAVKLTIAFQGQILTAYNVHAGADDVLGQEMLYFLVQQTLADPYFFSVGDNNFNLQTLADRKLLFDLRAFIAAVMNPDGSYADTRVNRSTGTRSALDYGVVGRNIVMQAIAAYETRTRLLTEYERSAKMLDRDHLVDHFAVYGTLQLATSTSLQRTLRTEREAALSMRLLPGRVIVSPRTDAIVEQKRALLGKHKASDSALDSDLAATAVARQNVDALTTPAASRKRQKSQSNSRLTAKTAARIAAAHAAEDGTLNNNATLVNRYINDNYTNNNNRNNINSITSGDAQLGGNLSDRATTTMANSQARPLTQSQLLQREREVRSTPDRTLSSLLTVSPSLLLRRGPPSAFSDGQSSLASETQAGETAQTGELAETADMMVVP